MKPRVAISHTIILSEGVTETAVQLETVSERS